MKKFLLTAFAVMAMGATAFAADVVLNANDAKDIKGEFVKEVPAADKNNGQAAHYQPLKSLVIGDYTLSFDKGNEDATEPALYLPFGTSNDNNIRVYKNNVMTITGPADAKISSVAFSGKDTPKDANSYCEGLGTNVVKFTNTTGKNARINTITLTIGGEVLPPVEIPTAKFQLATSVVSGNKYIMVTADGKVAIPIEEGKAYGYLYVEEPKSNANGVIETSEDNAITFANTGNGFTMVDCYGRFLGMDDSHNSFQLYKAADEGNCEWTVAIENGLASIVNVGREINVSWAENYKNFAPQGGDILPALYEFVDTDTAVKNIAVDVNAPAEYFNLQGIRVANPENGLYIVRQGNKVSKVIIRK